MSAFQLILGNQLFYPFTHLNKTCPIIMIEHKDLCQNYTYHKVKIAFFFAAMRHYRDDLEKQGFKVIYEPYNPEETMSFTDVVQKLAPTLSHLSIIEIVDINIQTQFLSAFKKNNIQTTVSQSPMFINPISHFSDYLSTIKKPFMKTYYERIRKSTGILMANGKPEGGKYSFDEMNRKKCPKEVVIPKRDFPQHSDITKSVISEVNRHFSSMLVMPMTYGSPSIVKML